MEENKNPTTIEQLRSAPILDVVKRYRSSSRLRHALDHAVESGHCPFKNVGDYLDLGQEAVIATQRMPLVGLKTAMELHALISTLAHKAASASANRADGRKRQSG